MFWKAFLSAAFYLFISLDPRMWGLNMMDRPIIICPVIGAIFGDLETGLIVGASLELMFMGVIYIGAATPPDVVSGSVLGTVLAILTGKGAEVALTLAIPLSLLVQSYNVLGFSLKSYVLKKGGDYAKKGDLKKMTFWHIVPPIIFQIPPAILVFISIYYGVDMMNKLVNIMPEFFVSSLQIAAGLLPAVGFAMLIDMMFTKTLAPFFFLGFVCATYFGLDVIAVGVVAVIIALIYFNFSKKSEESQTDIRNEEVF